MINEVLTIKQLLTNVEKLKAIEICDKILSKNFTHEYIINSTSPLTDIIYLSSG